MVDAMLSKSEKATVKRPTTSKMDSKGKCKEEAKKKKPLRINHHFQKTVKKLTVKWLLHAVLAAWPVVVSHP